MSETQSYKKATCCSHDCDQGRTCPYTLNLKRGPDALSVVLWGAILGLLVSPFVGG